MRVLLLSFLLPWIAVEAATAAPSVLEQSDSLSYEGKNQESLALLNGALSQASDGRSQAEIYWRLSRDTLNDADDRQASGASSDLLRSFYERGLDFADRAISLDPTNAQGYYWKAANLGRYSLTRGFVSALVQADPIRKLVSTAASLAPEEGDPWYVLGQIYEQVPGFPLSFGNVVWSVSLGRKGLDARKAEVAKGLERDIPLDYYVQLARHLQRRGWSVVERVREHAQELAHYNAERDVVERMCYYEGTLSLPPLSDREEARQLCRSVIDKLAPVNHRSRQQQEDLDNAKQTLAELS